jgi:hypothetical protein
MQFAPNIDKTAWPARVFFQREGSNEMVPIGTTGPMRITIDTINPVDPGKGFMRHVTAGAVSIAKPVPAWLSALVGAQPRRWRKRAIACRPLPKAPPPRRRQVLRGELTLDAPLLVNAGDRVRLDISGYRIGRTLRAGARLGSVSVAWSQQVTVSHDDLVNDTFDIREAARRAAQHLSARQDEELRALVIGSVSGDTQPRGALTVEGIKHDAALLDHAGEVQS